MPCFPVRRGWVMVSLMSGMAFAAHAQAVSEAVSKAVSKAVADKLAEAFIAKNGYTKLPREQLVVPAGAESLDRGHSRDGTLDGRFNALHPKAIGVTKGARGRHAGWSVAFDRVGVGLNGKFCRVVTMEEDGTKPSVQHVDGIRSHFVGLD